MLGHLSSVSLCLFLYSKDTPVVVISIAFILNREAKVMVLTSISLSWPISSGCKAEHSRSRVTISSLTYSIQASGVSPFHLSHSVTVHRNIMVHTHYQHT